MLAVAHASKLEMRVALSDMGQVLGREAGNALEVRAVLDILCGRGGDARLLELSLSLAGDLLCMGGLAADAGEARTQLQRALDSGAAAERFARMVAALGGPVDLLEDPEAHLPSAPIQQEVSIEHAGFVATVDVRALGHAVVGLGGGRFRPDQGVDPAVGLAGVAAPGEWIEPGQPLAVIHARTEADARLALHQVRRAFHMSQDAPAAVELFRWHDSGPTAA